MNYKEDFEYLRNLSKKELAEHLAENDRKGQLLIANPKYLTKEQIREREEIFEQLEEEKENAVPFEEAMEELLKFLEELEHERISNKSRANIL